MKKFLNYIIIIVTITLTIALTIIFIIINSNKKQKSNEEGNLPIALEENLVKDKQEDEVIVVGVDKKVEIVQEVKEDPKPEPPKDSATLTQEVYNINGPIGTLYIPKTRTKN